MAKYTDEQIKKALECCGAPTTTSKLSCNSCPILGTRNCMALTNRYALDLINRREEEIERLKEYEEIRPVGCPNCSRGNFSNSKFCSHCGTQLQGKKKDKDREIAEYKSEIASYKSEIEELKETLNATIAGQETLQKYIPIAKSEAIKECLEWLQENNHINFSPERRLEFVKEIVGVSK